MHLSLTARLRRRHRPRGQSLVELALILPVLLLLLLVTIDFGRIYLGWVNMQSSARIAANYAANNAESFATSDPATLAAYQQAIQQDASANNCELRDTAGNAKQADPPTFSGYALGDTVTASVTCDFTVLTPVISNIIGETIQVSASSEFPVKTGYVSGTNTGGGGGTPVTASFDCTPKSGAVPLPVQCNDESGGGPTSWKWTLSGPGGTTQTSGQQDPLFVLSDAGYYSVTLTVDNALNQPSTLTIGNYLNAGLPSSVDFVADKNSGKAPLTVTFTDQSTNSPTTWAWDFDNNGVVDDTTQNPTHTYTVPGSYSVKLTVTNAAGTFFTLKPNFITVNIPDCTVPSFTGIRRNNAQTRWAQANFTTTVTDRPGSPNGNYVIGFQSISNGSVVPCNSVIQVSNQ